MKSIILTTVISAVLLTLFFISFNWANGLDYSDPHSSLMPIGVAFLVGVAAFSSLGGIIGAIWEYNEN